MAIIIEEKPIEEMTSGEVLTSYAQARDFFDRFGIKVRHRSIQSDNYVPGVSGWILRANGTIEATQIIAGSYVTSFVQGTAPTSLHIGDLWIHTGDNNKVYRAESVGADEITAGEWVEYGTLANWSEIVDDDSHKPANNATVTFIQTTAPTAEQTGDLWIDSDDNSKMYRWSGSAWVSVRDGTIATAQSAAESAAADAATAQGEADRKVVTFIQTTAPTAEQTGDIWFDSDDTNKVYRWSGSAWVSAQDLAANWSAIVDDDGHKPDDDANEGATAGTDLKDSGAAVLEDEDIKNIDTFVAGHAIVSKDAVYVSDGESGEKVYVKDKPDSSGAGDAFGDGEAKKMVAQSFKIAADMYIGAVWVSLAGFGGGEELRVDLQADDGGEPSGVSLVGGYEAHVGPTGDGIYRLKIPYKCLTNVTYWFVFSTGTDDTINAGFGQGYTDGEALYYDGADWLSWGGGVREDMWFEIYEILPLGYIGKAEADVGGRYESFIGFASGAIAMDASGKVSLSGFLTGLSGLTPGRYYLSNTAGAISTSAGDNTRKVGMAISATALQITNIW